MKYVQEKRIKGKWDSLSNAGLLLLVKFGLALISILKVYRKKSSSILLRKKMFNLLLAFFFSQVLKDFSVENLETTLGTFLSKFSSEIYLPGIIIGVVFLHCISSVWGAVFFFFFCVVSAFSFFVLLFYRYFPWHYAFHINISQDSWEGKGNHYFSTSTCSRTFI